MTILLCILFILVLGVLFGVATFLMDWGTDPRRSSLTSGFALGLLVVVILVGWFTLFLIGGAIVHSAGQIG